jgi:DNA polymerase V
MKAIVDCNSFYCSCERLFRPDLEHKPVVVLSNNDGCIVSRSDEAKQFGVAMAGPYFEAKPLIEKYDIATFSSNYNLYGDLSWRVMETLRMIMGKKNVEVYSVDEAFVDMSAVPAERLHAVTAELKNTVEMWTGIKVSIGVAPTKVLAKVANVLAKKHKVATDCILILDTPNKLRKALQKTPIGDVWGVGRQYAKKLQSFGIETAFDFTQLNAAWVKQNMGGITGTKLFQELKGEPSIFMEDELINKKMIATTRMFGQPVTKLVDIKEAIATYTSRAAEKLRRQHSAANIISVFIVPKQQSHNTYFRHGPTISDYTTLPTATCITQDLIKPALMLTEKLFEAGNTYKKAGVMLSGIVPDSSIQGNLFVPEEKNKNRLLMTMMDNVNFAMRDDVLKFASSGTSRNWKMRQEMRSKRYTTRWEELFEIR